MPFDPDKYLASKQQPAAFDPDAYLSGRAAPVAATGTPSPVPAAPISGAGAGGADLQWQQPGYQEATAPPPQGEPSSGMIWPVSYSAEGEPSFDLSAGITGAIGRAAMAPGDVYTGKLDPMSPEGQSRATEFAALATPISAASRAGVGWAGVPKPGAAGGYKPVTPTAPTRKALKEATTKAYGEADALGAEYAPSAIKKWAGDTISKLHGDSKLARNYPKVHNILEELVNVPKDATSIKLGSIDAIYRELGDLGADVAEGKVANIVQKSLDDFHATIGPEALVAGTASPERAAMLLREGRGNAAAGFRSDRITGLEKTAARRTAASNSGRNTDNAIRQRLASFIESAKGSRGLSKAEERAIDDIIFGTPTKETARYFGNLLGGGGGLGQMLTMFGPAAMVGGSGAGIGATVAAMVPGAVGAAAKTAANRMTMKELKALDDMMRARSPLGEQSMAPQQVYAPSIAPETMAKALGAQAMAPPANGAMNRNRMIRAVGAPPGPGGYY